MGISRKEIILFSLNIILIIVSFIICYVYPREYIIFIENIKPINKYSIVLFLITILYTITLYSISDNSKN